MTDSVTGPPRERRSRVHAKVNYFACVRSEAFGDDVVVCMDMSRGGMSFKTKRLYAVSSKVRIAVPYSPETPQAPAIFVRGKIVNVTELPGGQLFRCGLQFLVTGAQF